MCNTPRDIIRYISSVASKDTMFEAANLHENVNNSRFAFRLIVSSENEKQNFKLGSFKSKSWYQSARQETLYYGLQGNEIECMKD